MKRKQIVGLSIVLAGFAINSWSAVVTNWVADPGFEAITGNEPNAGTTPWFTSGEGSDGSFISSTDQAHSGSQSVKFTFYFDDGAVVQNTGLQIESNKAYEASMWMLIDELSGSAAHSNASVVSFGLYTSTNGVAGTYQWRTSQYGNIPTTTNEWQQFSHVFHANLLTNYVGQFVQIRYAKQNASSTHKIYLDDTSFGEVDNEFIDFSFESTVGSEPNAATSPWFTMGEGADGSFITSSAEAHSGDQSAKFDFYFDEGAIVQNLNLQVDTSKIYDVSMWMLTSEPSGNVNHTNPPSINIGLYTSTNSGVSYSFRTTLFSGALNSTTNLWEQFSATVEGLALASWAGEDMQIRFNKPDKNTTHKMYIDDVSMVVTDNPAPTTGYAGWAAGWGVDIGAETNDYDSDGLSNIYEYGLEGDPTNPADQGTSPGFAVENVGGTNWFGYVHPQLSDPDSGIVYFLELNTDLVFGNWTNDGYAVTGTNVTGGTLDFVTNVTDTVDVQKFIRLIIE